MNANSIEAGIGARATAPSIRDTIAAKFLVSWFKKPNAHEWRKSPPPADPHYQGLGQTWNYVDTVTGRCDDATITKRSDESYYVIWVRGAGYGHYFTIDDAFKAAEEICKKRGIA